MHLRPALSAALALCAMLSGALCSAAETLPEQSPFLPPAGAAPAQPADTAGFELVGMTTVGRDTMVSILRLSDQRSTWVPVGRTVGDITVVRYNPTKDEAVIRVGGRELTLPMRKGSVLAGANVAPAPLPPGATSARGAAPTLTVPNTPLTPTEEKEMEARMLVSDLLEIGQQQRKAYEEAQRQAAAKAAAAKKASSPPPATSPTQPASNPPPAAGSPKK